MNFAPKHDFQLFLNATELQRLELERQASPTQKVQRFADLIAVGNGVEKPNMTIREIRQRWLAEEVAARRKQLVAFANADGEH